MGGTSGKQKARTEEEARLNRARCCRRQVTARNLASSFAASRVWHFRERPLRTGSAIATLFNSAFFFSFGGSFSDLNQSEMSHALRCIAVKNYRSASVSSVCRYKYKKCTTFERFRNSGTPLINRRKNQAHKNTDSLKHVMEYIPPCVHPNGARASQLPKQNAVDGSGESRDCRSRSS